MDNVNVGSVTLYRSGCIVSVGVEDRSSNVVPIVDVMDADYIEGNPLEFAETFRHAAQFFKPFNLQKISISAFGPFHSLYPSDEGYGQVAEVMTDSGASGQKLKELAITNFGEGPDIVILTDASAVALGETCRRFHLSRFPFDKHSITQPSDIDSKFRSTVTVGLLFGKGVGGGISIGGQLWNGRLHPEMGHLTVGRIPNDRRVAIGCSHHKDCVTGLISRAALEDSNGLISDRNWDLFSAYAARLCIAITHIIAPSAIVLSGSTIRLRPNIAADIRDQFNTLLCNPEGNRYLKYPEMSDLEQFISIAAQESGSYGTLAAATDASIKATRLGAR